MQGTAVMPASTADEVIDAFLHAVAAPSLSKATRNILLPEQRGAVDRSEKRMAGCSLSTIIALLIQEHFRHEKPSSDGLLQLLCSKSKVLQYGGANYKPD